MRVNWWLVLVIGCVCQMGLAESLDEKVDALFNKMTLEEKIGQLNQYNGFWDATGPEPTEEDDRKTKYKHLMQGRVGAVLNVAGAKRVRELQKLVVEKSRLGIPLLFGLDVVHGYKTMFPIPLAESASWDMEAIQKSARIAAIEASAQGINWTFAPMVDISHDARWGRVAEGAGEDPFLGQAIARARVKGFQGDDLAAEDTIAACAKHFAAYGFVEAGRDYNRVDISRYTLYNTVLPPFQAAVEADVKTLMNSFNSLNGVPATASAFLQRDILKNKWGFKGFVVSDWTSMLELIKHGYAENNAHAAELSLKAGSDMDMESYVYLQELEGLVKNGKIQVSLIDDAVKRILKVKFELGLFDDPYRYVSEERENDLIFHPNHLASARDMARKSIVLLKNNNGLLPLPRAQKNIAVIGPLAQDKDSVLGTWRAVAAPNSARSLLEGLKHYSDQIKYAQGVKFTVGPTSLADPVVFDMEDRSGIEEAKTLAAQSEVVILFLGEHGYQSGEGRSRTQLDLPGLQQELLEAVYSVNKNIILLVASGRPLVLNWADQHIPVIVQTWQLGSESGNAIADILFGDYNPSGKLPMSFPRSVGQMPYTYRVSRTGRPDPLPTVYWSQYNDVSNDPLYPFGHGLSYTQFEYSNLKINVLSDNKVRVRVTVKNIGGRSGEEVVQLYIRDKFASLVRPIKELKGFKKILLNPDQTQEVEFKLGPNELGFFNEEGEFLLEPGEFDAMLGGSSITTLQQTFILPPKAEPIPYTPLTTDASTDANVISSSSSSSNTSSNASLNASSNTSLSATSTTAL